jgi:hypothetical protein
MRRPWGAQLPHNADPRARARFDRRRADEARASLLARLHDALGATALLRPHHVDRHRPERAWAGEDPAPPPRATQGPLEAALAEDPTRRPTAHELADRVQAFLDGDRDLVRRRELAAEQLASARTLLDSGAPDARAAGMRRAGRALALDPQSEDAAELVSTLLLEPPPRLPPRPNPFGGGGGAGGGMAALMAVEVAGEGPKLKSGLAPSSGKPDGASGSPSKVRRRQPMPISLRRWAR